MQVEELDDTDEMEPIIPNGDNDDAGKVPNKSCSVKLHRIPAKLFKFYYNQVRGTTVSEDDFSPQFISKRTNLVSSNQENVYETSSNYSKTNKVNTKVSTPKSKTKSVKKCLSVLSMSSPESWSKSPSLVEKPKLVRKAKTFLMLSSLDRGSPNTVAGLRADGEGCPACHDFSGFCS